MNKLCVKIAIVISALQCISCIKGSCDCPPPLQPSHDFRFFSRIDSNKLVCANNSPFYFKDVKVVEVGTNYAKSIPVLAYRLHNNSQDSIIYFVDETNIYPKIFYINIGSLQQDTLVVHNGQYNDSIYYPDSLFFNRTFVKPDSNYIFNIYK